MQKYGMSHLFEAILTSMFCNSGMSLMRSSSVVSPSAIAWAALNSLKNNKQLNNNGELVFVQSN